MKVGALVVLAFLGNGLIYAGLALINARLWPSALSGFYGATSVAVRIVVMEVLFAVPANAIFALIFRLFPAVYASVAILATLVLVMSANAVLLGVQMNVRMTMAMLATLLACGWFAYEQAVA